MIKSHRMLYCLPGVLFFTLHLYAQNYLWPTNSSNFVSSSFCEFREGHYHSAIDIKTWLREGYPCYAVEDGYIELIRISPFGYGKVLYLKLSDGNTAVYAHLQRFSKPLESVIRSMQFENQRYSLEWRPDRFEVKKGDIIAYTGGTGAGPPHLHFEIRNQAGNPVNPLHFYPEYRDDLRPGLKSLICIPLSAGATINGSYLPQKFHLTYSKDGYYKTSESIRVTGSVGLGIKGFDQAVELGNSFGFYETMMLAENDTVFHIRYDELRFAETAHIFTEIYYPAWTETGEVFHKLYIEDHNRLSLYPRRGLTDGIIQLKDQPLSLTVLIHDIRFNQSIIKIELMPDSQENIRIETMRRDGNWIYLTLFSDSVRELVFETGKDRKYLEPVKYFEITEGQVSNPSGGLGVKVDIGDSTNTLLKIIIQTTGGRFEQTCSFGRIDPVPLKQSPEFYFLGSDLVLQFNKINLPAELRVTPGNFAFPLRAGRNRRYEAAIPGNSLIPGKNKFQLQIFSDIIWSGELQLDRLYPNKTGEYSWYDSGFVLTTGKESVSDTVLITVDSLDPDILGDLFPMASPVYEIAPDNFPVFENLSLRIKADSLPDWGRWSIYQVERPDKVSFLASQIDPDNMILTARVESPGRFIVASDTVPPVLEILSPQNGRTYTKNPPVKFKLDDPLSGIKQEKNISVSLDGLFVLPEWDPEKKLVQGSYDMLLEPGTHILTVSVKDEAGNTRRKAVFFTIQ